MENNMAGSSEKLKIELLCGPAILFLGKYPRELKAGSQRDICTSMSILALFTTAKRWEEHKCPLMDE